jgi:hypothetical protein
MMVKLTAAVACCVVVSLGTLAPAQATARRAPAADPPGTVRVTPATGSTLFDTVGVVAGSSRDAVLTVSQTTDTNGPGLPYRHLFARSSSGSTTDLGQRPLSSQEFSLVDGSLTTPEGGTQQVDWWDVTAGTHGSVTMPAGQEYLSSAPGGLLVRDRDRLLQRSTTTGGVTDLGTPFPGSTRFLAVAGGSGVVLTDADPAQPHATLYRSFTGSGFRTLPGTGTRDLSCTSLAGGFAGCSDIGSGAAVLVPLDGTRQPTTGAGAGVLVDTAIAGSTLLWQSGDQRLHSITYGDSTVHNAATALGIGVTGAYGVALVPDASNTQVLRVTSAQTAPTVLLPAVRSPVTTSSVSLSPGRLVDNDDRQVGAASPTSTFDTAVATSSRPPTVGATTLLHAGSYFLDAQGSGTTTVYVNPGARFTEDRVVRTPHGSRTIAGTAEPEDNSRPDSSVSGNRFVYLSAPAGTREPAAYLYDATTGRTTLEQRTLDVSMTPPVLFGDYLAMMRSDGTVWRRNVVTGAIVQLSRPVSELDYGQLFIYGDLVGWNIETGADEDVDNPTVTETYAYRNAKTLAPAHGLSQAISQLSSAGPVLSAKGRVLYDYTDSGYSLLTWAGTQVPLLPEAAYQSSPQVEGTTMAWGDRNGVLKVAPVPAPIVPAPPRFLGDPLAPAALHDAGAVGWRTYAPFSAPLTSCSAGIGQGSTVVRTLACDPAHMRVGVADVAWDGTFGGHRARAGDYRYRLQVRGSGGASLNGSGDPGSPARTIQVGHPTRMAIIPEPSTIRRGARATLRGRLVTSFGSPHGSRRVVFYRRADSSWRVAGVANTARGGSARLSVAPRTTTAYRAVFAGSFLDRASTSRSVFLHVR